MIPFRIDDEKFHNVNEAMKMSTEPNDDKLVIPFQIGVAALHTKKVESQKPAPISLTGTKEELKGPVMRHKNLRFLSAFTPDEFDVICSRGREAKNHTGNLLLQTIIKKTAPKYATAEGKLSKSIIVSEIVDVMRRRSATGSGFVKRIGGHWYELGELGAREKVSQSLRDLLHGQYKSSAKSKKHRKNETIFRMMKDLETSVDSNKFISSRTDALKESIQQFGDSLSDGHLLLMMTKMNCDILDQFKADPELQRRFGQMHMQVSPQAPTIPQQRNLHSAY